MVPGLVIATAGAISRDLYGKVVKKGHVDHKKQLTVARIATVSTGVMWGMVVGLVSAIGIILVSPVFRGQDALLPISSPGIISIPLGFLVTWVVSMMTQPKGEASAEADTLFDRIRVQAVTGMDPGEVSRFGVCRSARYACRVRRVPMPCG